MDRCRTCLGNKKTYICIYDYDKNNYKTYAEMITSIGNVKIGRNDGMTDQICRGCRKSLLEAYNFKLLIERSDVALNRNSNLKILKFNSIKDIKIEIDIDTKPILKSEDVGQYFTESVAEFTYNNVVIKKIEPKDDDMHKKIIPVQEFLDSIKNENNINYGNMDDMDVYGESMDDNDYVPDDDEESKLIKKIKKYKRKARKDEDEDYLPETIKWKFKNKLSTKKGDKEPIFLKEGTRVSIKPVYLKDLRLFQPPPQPKPKSAKKYTYPKMCPHCGKMVTSIKIHILTKHTGNRNYICDICNKTFCLERQLEYHKRKIHAATRDFKCEHCIAAFKDKFSLRNHQNMHSAEKKFICDLCSKAFKRNHSLRRHRMMHNAVNKNIMCDLCNMSFFTKPALSHHLRVHTGERPFNCEICSQPYSYKHDFNRHCLKKHGVFLKQREVHVMNEQVLKQERELMKELALRVHGLIDDDKPLSQYDGPKGALALKLAVKAMQARQIPLDLPI